jgi:uncharacterized membrane protein YbhN (UPF0104 family)
VTSAAVKKAAGAAVRIGISAILVAILIIVARKQNVLGTLEKVAPGQVVVALFVLTCGWLLNSIRWRMLLSVVGAREKYTTLASLYFIGMFFSQMLPTGAGGDAVRMYELYRRGHTPAAVVVATLQERLLGMGMSLLMALVILPVYFDQLPPAIRPMLVALPIAAITGVAIFLYPRLPLRLLGVTASSELRRVRTADHLSSGPPESIRTADPTNPTSQSSSPLTKIKHRLIHLLRPAAHLPALTPSRLIPILFITLLGDIFSISVWYILGRAVGIPLSLPGYFLIVPLVWVISMFPSLGGAGVREGGFVWLMLMFHVPKDQSLAVAALYLIVQILLATAGGLLLLGRIWSGDWKPRSEVPQNIEPIDFPAIRP